MENQEWSVYQLVSESLQGFFYTFLIGFRVGYLIVPIVIIIPTLYTKMRRKEQFIEESVLKLPLQPLQGKAW